MGKCTHSREIARVQISGSAVVTCNTSMSQGFFVCLFLFFLILYLAEA